MRQNEEFDIEDIKEELKCEFSEAVFGKGSQAHYYKSSKSMMKALSEAFNEDMIDAVEFFERADLTQRHALAMIDSTGSTQKLQDIIDEEHEDEYISVNLD